MDPGENGKRQRRVDDSAFSGRQSSFRLPPPFALEGVNATPQSEVEAKTEAASDYLLKAPCSIRSIFSDAWLTKTPNIEDHSVYTAKELSDRSNVHFRIQGIAYPVKKLAVKSCNNWIWNITSKAVLELDGKLINASELILKTPEQGSKNGLKVQKELKEGVQAYQFMSTDPEVQKLLKKIGVVLPACYINPATYSDSVNPRDGGFWAFEKMDREVDCSEWQPAEKIYQDLSPAAQHLLLTVKLYLTETVKLQRELLFDFKPDNLMYNKLGQIAFVDFALPPSGFEDSSDIVPHLKSYLKKWANGNKGILEFLIGDFPETHQPQYAFSKVYAETLEDSESENW